MKKYLKNKKFIISSSLIIIAIISVIIVKYSTSVNSINRVNKVLPLKYYDISCIDDECEYIQAKKGDKLKKSKVVILDNNGKKIGKYNEVYNSKDKTDRIIYMQSWADLNGYLKDKDASLSICESLSINPLSRPEQLSPEMYLAISESISSK